MITQIPLETMRATMKSEPVTEQTVFLIEDDDDVRNSLTFFLEGYHLRVKAFHSGNEFLEQLDPKADGCAIIDIRMPLMSGTELQQKLKDLQVTFPIIMLTAHGEVPVAVESIKEGAFHFMLKSESQQSIINTVFAALKHSRANHRANCDVIATSQLIKTLSKRELEVVDLVIQGMTSREISNQLDIKIKTVDAHRANLMRKMEASNVADLINKIVTYRKADRVHS